MMMIIMVTPMMMVTLEEMAPPDAEMVLNDRQPAEEMAGIVPSTLTAMCL